jgi:uncharacterized protein HemX
MIAIYRRLMATVARSNSTRRLNVVTAMLERFLARVGTVGAILILALAVVVVGFGGGVVEHLRLTATQSEQQGKQNGTQSESQKGEQGDKGESQPKKGAQSAPQGGSQESDTTTQAGQKDEQGDHQTGSE